MSLQPLSWSSLLFEVGRVFSPYKVCVCCYVRQGASIFYVCGFSLSLSSVQQSCFHVSQLKDVMLTGSQSVFLSCRLTSWVSHSHGFKFLSSCEPTTAWSMHRVKFVIILLQKLTVWWLCKLIDLWKLVCKVRKPLTIQHPHLLKEKVWQIENHVSWH